MSLLAPYPIRTNITPRAIMPIPSRIATATAILLKVRKLILCLLLARQTRCTKLVQTEF